MGLVTCVGINTAPCINVRLFKKLMSKCWIRFLKFLTRMLASQEDTECHCIYALEGKATPTTLKTKGTSKTNFLLVSIESGSTPSYVPTPVAHEMKWRTLERFPITVTSATGHELHGDQEIN
ncbi:conserved hypothetical protein [Ricinus communis]|uniref:Uncharacterized protein n=1 Tax=Ricinus communis TaxID=3988 RepID=B9R6W8_RICCO|nr:conserved hypothetical protein [Ricinus communis]